MKSTSSIRGFLTTKKLLDQDKKTLSKDASQKSLSRASAKLKRIEDALDENPNPRTHFQDFDREQEFEEEFRPAQPQYKTKFNTDMKYKQKAEGASPYRPSKSRVVDEQRDGSIEQHHQEERKDLWAGITNIDNNFKSSRQEYRQALDSLSRRIEIQLKMFSNSIDDYRGRIKRTFEIEYERLREYAHDLVEKTFRRFEQEMKEAYLKQEARINRKVYDTKKDLEQLFRSVDEMKEGLEGPQWKKIAGEILSSDFLARGETVIEEASEKLVLADLQLAIAPSKRQSLQSVLSELVQMRVERRPVDGLLRLA